MHRLIITSDGGFRRILNLNPNQICQCLVLHCVLHVQFLKDCDLLDKVIILLDYVFHLVGLVADLSFELPALRQVSIDGLLCSNLLDLCHKVAFFV